ncbi:bifunctional diaminohydroxyphosphoribosylaminopyrimidine deaminase/5-amino-6-(5-phosphoribosylamino)uracil reductase RibD [Paenibacillus sp. CAA11]|uniref:bifunctional diaminohydroxyphosphoribosylaminopyrimidine deaminase/5-amino-6-(5-phosphoribosylamino)uracil reductase RibD n=1 Tax=Paenibacillus sp. CAA11 TaxID=1532905 RepID=UPI000D380FF4|nr:bifunctional diaminohydroxyphosphoribosylaminopyrimidine deaminase/5-amino-6-(5-phosphoribosylamino)uracil reductase RibD [Paenibacillus sp. CAA11]AWB45054.1 bifunctional diaminohydroxyphosphoribosylaminopyrimidine deaminase/5-amino-6-(5-phosphoribosylamino)uracil reductase RibD [Paenibacillus sp. CAA11]
MQLINDEYYMSLALDMAERTQGQTGINPVVGAVVFKNGAVIGMGAHLKRGSGHAEVHALNMAGAEAEGSTVYVSLEPCSHYGTTPPCSERLIAEKVARVVVACEDPNPLVAGRGIAMLREAGIEVVTGVLRERALELNKRFIKFITTGMPYVTVKTASTLDGKIASKTGDSKWITGTAARQRVHIMRHRHMGIMVGIETVIADDPMLTTRLEVPGISPVRIIVDSRLRIPIKSKVLQEDAEKTLILTTRLSEERRRAEIAEAGAKVLLCGDGPQVDLKHGLKQLAQLGISSVLVEGGGKLSGSLLVAKLVDELVLFMAPKLIGGNAPGSFTFEGYERMADAMTLADVKVEQVGEDICITGRPEWRDA